jgi:hypothetical protein
MIHARPAPALLGSRLILGRLQTLVAPALCRILGHECFFVSTYSTTIASHAHRHMQMDGIYSSSTHLHEVIRSVRHCQQLYTPEETPYADPVPFHHPRCDTDSHGTI